MPTDKFKDTIYPDGNAPDHVDTLLSIGCKGSNLLFATCGDKPEGNKHGISKVSEDIPNTTCYSKQEQADAHTCPNEDDHQTIWAKQGKWKDGKNPTPDDNGVILNDSIGDGDDGTTFNYITKHGSGCYSWMDHGSP